MAFSYSKPEPLNSDFESFMDDIFESMDDKTEKKSTEKQQIEQKENEASSDNNTEEKSYYKDNKASQRQYWSFMDEAPILEDKTGNTEVVESAVKEENTKMLSDFGKSFTPSLLDKFKRDVSKETVNEPKIEEQKIYVEKPAKVDNVVEKKSKKKEKKVKKTKAEKKAIKQAEKEESLTENLQQIIKDDAYKTKTPKNRSFGEAFRIAVIIISSIGLIASIGFIGFKVYQSWYNKRANASIIAAVDNKAEWAKIKAKYPNINFPPEMNVKYAELYAQNQDFVGFVSIKGIDINLPVVHGKDDEYYLHYNFKKQKSVFGTAFLSSHNSFPKKGTKTELAGFNYDFNNVIYAHSSRRGTQMFTNLNAYKDIARFSEIPIINFDTIYGLHQYKVFAVFITNGGGAGDLNKYIFNYFFPNLATPEKKAEYLNELKQRRLYDTGVDVNENDKLITLSTCTYEFNDARLVVVGRELRPGEKTDIDTSKIKLNNNPRMPQAWYSRKGTSNPFAGSPQWNPIS